MKLLKLPILLVALILSLSLYAGTNHYEHTISFGEVFKSTHGEKIFFKLDSVTGDLDKSEFKITSSGSNDKPIKVGTLHELYNLDTLTYEGGSGVISLSFYDNKHEPLITLFVKAYFSGGIGRSHKFDLFPRYTDSKYYISYQSHNVDWSDLPNYGRLNNHDISKKQERNLPIQLKIMNDPTWVTS